MTYYYLYQITNLVNAKIYVGVHKTKSLDDGYMGSGKIIRSAIAKYGISNFSKDILEFFDTSESMYAKEKEVVTAEFLLREDTYNLRRGGFGGFDYINSTVDFTLRNTNASRAGNIGAKRSNTIKQHWLSGKYSHIDKSYLSAIGTANWIGEHHTEITKQKMSIAKKGKGINESNSQFGTMWITDGTSNKKVKKDAVIPEGWNKGRK